MNASVIVKQRLKTSWETGGTSVSSWPFLRRVISGIRYTFGVDVWSDAAVTDFAAAMLSQNKNSAVKKPGAHTGNISLTNLIESSVCQTYVAMNTLCAADQQHLGSFSL